MNAVYKRELKAYTHNVYGFLFASVLLLVVGVMVFMINLNPNLLYADMTFALQYGEIALLLMVPVLCMRTMSEDRRNKTDMFYLSLPLRTSDVVLGKYFALLTVYAVPTLILCAYPLILGCFGQVNYLHTYLGILMFYLLGASLMAVCMYVSSLTAHLVISAALGVLATLLLYLLPQIAVILPATPIASYIGFLFLLLLLSAGVFAFTKSYKVTLITAAATIVPLSAAFVVTQLLFQNDVLADAAFENLFPAFLCNLSPFFQFDGMVNGQLFDLFGLGIMLSFIVFFVFLTIQSADKRRWS